MTEAVTYLEILHRICVRQGWALLLTATIHPAGFAEKASTELRALTVADPGLSRYVFGVPRGDRIKAGVQVATCALDGVAGDLDAAAELLVELLTHRKAEAA